MLRTDDRGILPLLPLLLLLIGGVAALTIIAFIIKGLAVIIAIIAVIAILFFALTKMPNKKHAFVIAIAAIIVIPLFVFVMLGPMALFEPTDFNTNGWVNTDVLQDSTLSGGKTWFRFSGSFNGQMFDATTYATPFRKGDYGSTVYLQSKTCVDTNMALPEQSIKHAEWHIRHTEGITWSTEPNKVVNLGEIEVITCDKGWTPIGVPWVYKLSNEDKVGYLKADLHIEFHNGKRYHSASDYAYFYDGSSEITKPPTGYVAIVGSQLEIQFKLGWACSTSETNTNEKTQAEGGGWTAAIYSQAQNNKKVGEWSLGCGGPRTPDYKSVYYTPTSNDFSNEGGCKQKLTIELYNNLKMQSDKIVYTLDLSKAFKLTKPSLEVESSTVYVGDTIKAKANSSIENVEYYWIARYVGGRTIKWDNTTSNEFTVEASMAGEIEIVVNCHDAQDCSISDPEMKIVRVLELDEDGDLDIPSNWLGIIILIIIIIVLVLVGFFLPLPTWMKIIYFACAVGIPLLFAWLLGVF